MLDKLSEVIALVSIALGWFLTYQQAMKIREERKEKHLKRKKKERKRQKSKK
ncbi:MAG: hypothetical protein FWG63_05065 [Defluviitaleaceae bacterium]|nr:hypothetical protein [Defluviitaleaceae bacterium]